jgi:hypothetical protein
MIKTFSNLILRDIFSTYGSRGVVRFGTQRVCPPPTPTATPTHLLPLRLPTLPFAAYLPIPTPCLLSPPPLFPLLPSPCSTRPFPYPRPLPSLLILSIPFPNSLSSLLALFYPLSLSSDFVVSPRRIVTWI